MQPRTRLGRQPASRLRLAAYGGLVTAGLTASLIGVIDRVDAPVGAIVPRYDSDTYRLVLRLDTRPTVMQDPEAGLGR